MPSHEIRSHKFGLYDFCDSRGRELTSKHTADCVKSERKVRVAMIYDIDEKFGSELANRLPMPQHIDFGLERVAHTYRETRYNENGTQIVDHTNRVL